MKEVSGAQWCGRHLGSHDLADLVEPFRGGAIAYVEALRAAGASVSISATWRPAERAYLMHYCCLVAGYRDKSGVFHQISPDAVPAFAGVDIDWTHGGDVGGARAAAVAMREAYSIAFPAALVSNHTRRTAIDMTIHWAGTIHVKDARGVVHAVTTQQDLWPIGASFGVRKLPSDDPHWGSDGT